MGVTFLEYQNELRLSYIYRDLITTEDSVRDILERHGFTNYKLFRRMFGEQFGDTPSGVRKLPACTLPTGKHASFLSYSLLY